MRTAVNALSVLAAASALLAASGAVAQPLLTLPQPSQGASVSQTIGLTQVTITYHRPLVKGRKIWGGLVPYDEVWRAGANENTTISFSTPVKVAGHPLAAGTYGFFVIPRKEGEWTAAFSSTNTAWGAFTYDEKEDVLRIPVKPEPAPEFEEALTYGFRNATRDSAEIVFEWEKVRLAFPVEADTTAVTLDSIHKELRGLSRFSWQGWNQAAAFCLQNKTDVDEGLKWADRSLGMNENFQNLRVKAGLLDLKGEKSAADALRQKAIRIATEGDINGYGYQLLGENKLDEALSMFQKNVKDHPASWNVWDSLGEGYDRKGETKLAIENYTKALGMAPEDQKKRIEGVLRRLKAGS